MYVTAEKLRRNMIIKEFEVQGSWVPGLFLLRWRFAARATLVIFDSEEHGSVDPTFADITSSAALVADLNTFSAAFFLVCTAAISTALNFGPKPNPTYGRPNPRPVLQHSIVCNRVSEWDIIYSTAIYTVVHKNQDIS